MASEQPGSLTGNPDEPPGLDTSVPHISRIQNYWRGGKDNYAADRKAAEHIMAAAAPSTQWGGVARKP
jgi:hypothetical protein